MTFVCRLDPGEAGAAPRPRVPVFRHGVSAEASAALVTAASATSSGGFYPSCGGQSLLQSLRPDASPPAPPTSCGDHSAPWSAGTLTAQLGSHSAGSLTASVYVHDDLRSLKLRLYVNGVQVGSTLAAVRSTSGWLSFPPAFLAATDSIALSASADSTGSGYVRVYVVHGDIAPTSLGQPGNWAATPIPPGVVLDSHLAPNGVPLITLVPAELAGQAAADSWVNQRASTAKSYYVPLSRPLQPVRRCRYASHCVPNWGTATDDLWRAAMGEATGATFDRTTGKPIVDQYIGGGVPLTAGITGSPDSDKEAVVCLGGGNSRDPAWLLRNPDTTVSTRPGRAADRRQLLGAMGPSAGSHVQPRATHHHDEHRLDDLLGRTKEPASSHRRLARPSALRIRSTRSAARTCARARPPGTRRGPAHRARRARPRLTWAGASPLLRRRCSPTSSSRPTASQC
jgi:hypothetical protein